MSIPINETNTSLENSLKTSVNEVSETFVNSYNHTEDVIKQPSSELVNGSTTQVNPIINPEEEYVQLANLGKFTPYIKKMLGFDTWSVLNQSNEITKQKQKLIDRGVDPREFDADNIVIDKSWQNYMQPNESSILVDPSTLRFNEKNNYRTENAKVLMESAKNGKVEKRQPIAVLDKGDGTFEVIDGNTTVGVARNSEWSEIPVQVFNSKKEYQEFVETNKIEGHDKSELNHPIEVAKKNAIKNSNLDSSLNGVANNASANKLVEENSIEADFTKNITIEKTFFNVGGKLDKNGKNIFNETQAEALANKLVKTQEGTVAKNVDKKGNLIDFRAFGTESGEVNFDKAIIPNETSVYEAINQISKNNNYRERINEGDREHITNSALQELADLVGVNKEKLESTILGRHNGNVFNVEGQGLAETMLAARQLLVNEVNVLDELAAKGLNGSDSDKLAFRTQLELVAQLQSQIKGSQTEIARALQQFQVPVRSGEGTKLKADDAKRILDDNGGSDNVRDQIEAYMNVGDVVNRANFTREASKYKKFGDGLYEAWINILLSSPVTHVKNISGAFLQIFAHVGESMVQVGVNRTQMALGGKDSGIRMSDTSAQMYGMIMSLSDAWSMAGRGFKYGEKVVSGSKLQGSDAKFRERAWSSEDTGWFGNFVNITGRFATLDRVPTKMLEFEDNFFKVIAQKQFVYESAMRTGREKGLNGDALAHHLAEFVTNPPANILKEADAHARYVTLQTDLKGMGKNLQGVRNNAFLKPPIMPLNML